MGILACHREKPALIECDTATACEGCCVDETIVDTGDADHVYGYLDLFGSDGFNDNGSNWTRVDGRPVNVDINVDIDSITRNVYQWTSDGPGGLLTREGAVAAVDACIEYWNSAEAGVTIGVASYDKNCCDSGSDADEGCTSCWNDEENDIFFYEDVSESLSPGLPTAGFTHATAALTCLDTADILLFPRTNSEPTDSGASCSLVWEYPYTSGDEVECADGDMQKAFRDTLIHELGHFLGIEGDDDPWGSSAVSYACAAAAGCSYDTISNLDRRALEALYAQCDM